MKKIDKREFITVCENSLSMAQAAETLGLHFNTFKKYALKFGCYQPNQSGRGISKSGKIKYSTKDILSGKYPHYQTFKLKIRLLNEDVFENKCSECGIEEWNGNAMIMELDHINGNRSDHRKENLRMLCPNCHSQTETYRAKNIKS